MRNLIVCADGTWNTPEDTDGGVPTPTNVVKLHNAIAEPGPEVEQKRYYHPGVGTDGSFFDRLLGGGIGKGLDANIKSAYKWLAATYRPEDRIFLFGYSRGAYTVRSLGGMLSACGLLDLTEPGIGDKKIWKRVDTAFACYRDPDHDLTPLSTWPFHNAETAADAPGATPIHFIGIWDTVGALGVPDDLALLNLIDDPKDHQFHNTDLGENVAVARHAVAMDEMRQSFTPTLWTGFPPTQDVKQIWFPGVHGDVGGGYVEAGLSDGALLWMMNEAAEAELAFRDGAKDQLDPDFQAVLHDSRTGVFRALKSEPRRVPQLPKDEDSDVFHASAIKRHRNPPLSQGDYWPTRTLEPLQSTSLRIFARERWNVTRLFLEADVTYRFTASGEWLDGSIPCGPEGTKDGEFHLAEVAHVAASALGQVETLFRKIAGNPKADFWATKRVEKDNWFALIGMVANGAVDGPEGHPPENEVFTIGEGCSFTPKRGGYLYCFANDAWHAYDNNKGSVSLTAKRMT